MGVEHDAGTINIGLSENALSRHDLLQCRLMDEGVQTKLL